MQLSKRETSLIDIFIKYGMTLTGQELADLANVSTKTVYRTIKKINEASEAGEIILAEVGRGFQLDYECYLKEIANHPVSNQIHEPAQRRNAVLLTLLFKSPKKIRIKELFENYYISDAVISNDFQRITRFLQGFDLTLYRKENRVCVTGSEKNIRKAVTNLINARQLWEEEFSIEKQKISSYDINFITSLLEYIEQVLGSGVASPYNMNIFSHMYILMVRIREGELHPETNFEPLDPEEQVLVAENKELYQLATVIIQKINAYLAKTLPESEIFYLFQYLISSRMENNRLEVQIQSSEAVAITKYFSQQMENRMGIALGCPQNMQELLAHIQPLLYRLKNEIVVKNDLLNDIRLEYPEIFQQVKEVCLGVEEIFQVSQISLDEIGFLTLYFVKYKEIHKRKQRVLIMCSSGVGTSELLKVKVCKAFPELEIVDVLSVRKFQRAPENYPEVDLILTTVHLKPEMAVPNILVNSVFTKQDEQRVKQMLGEM